MYFYSRPTVRSSQQRGWHHLGQHLLRLPAAAETGLHELLLPPRGGGHQSVTDPRIQVQNSKWFSETRRVCEGVRVSPNVEGLIHRTVSWFSRSPPDVIHLRFRGAELFQATIVKAVRARLEEERKSVEQLKRQ